jgi:hypothetical protein
MNKLIQAILLVLVGLVVLTPGVAVGAARALPVPSGVPREGRRLFIGRDGGGAERPVALSAEAARHHMVAAGISGSGKAQAMRTPLDLIELPYSFS